LRNANGLDDLKNKKGGNVVDEKREGSVKKNSYLSFTGTSARRRAEKRFSTNSELKGQSGGP